MRIFKPLIKLSVIFFLLSPKHLIADEITIAADPWCPINCEPKSPAPGFMIDIAKTIFHKHGHTIKYINLPWTRAIGLARNGEINGVVGASKGDAPDFIYPEHEQATLSDSFYVLKNSPWKFKGIASLKEINLGCINGYDYGESLNNYIHQAATDRVFCISGDEDLLERLVTLLELNRIDVIIETDLIFAHKLASLNKANLFRKAGQVSTAIKTYIAFSPTHPKSKAYSEILSNGMEDIKRSGELNTIMMKYGISY